MEDQKCASSRESDNYILVHSLLGSWRIAACFCVLCADDGVIVYIYLEMYLDHHQSRTIHLNTGTSKRLRFCLSGVRATDNDRTYIYQQILGTWYQLSSR